MVNTLGALERSGADTHLDTQGATMSHAVDRGNSGRYVLEIATKSQSDIEGQAGCRLDEKGSCGQQQANGG